MSNAPATLPDDPALLKAMIVALQTENARMSATLRAHDQLIQTLRLRIAKLKKQVFGKWLFARPFFWEDVFSMVVIALHTAYLAMLIGGLGSIEQRLLVALAAYATYVVNAGQFLLKLRAARLEDPRNAVAPG